MPGSYRQNKELGLNTNGVIEQFRHKGRIDPVEPKSPHFVVNDGGWITPLNGQTGWRIQCDQVGSHGGYAFHFGAAGYESIAGNEADQFDFTIEGKYRLTVERIGIISSDWGMVMVTRVMGKS